MEPEKKDRPSEQPKSKPRKPYVKPDIIYRAPLEAMAGVCLGAAGKIPGRISCTVTQS